MLLIPTYLKETPGKGIGLFTKNTIKKGTVIWKYSPFVDKQFSETTFSYLASTEQEFLRCYASHENDHCWHLSVDNDRFINHSEHPNVTYENRVGEALRDINPDEEITTDYRLFDVDCAIKLGFINNE